MEFFETEKERKKCKKYFDKDEGMWFHRRRRMKGVQPPNGIISNGLCHNCHSKQFTQNQHAQAKGQAQVEDARGRSDKAEDVQS